MKTETIRQKSNIIVLTGKPGVGKATVGPLLSDALDWTYYDGDDFHPPTNIEKMVNGISLTDEDRQPWLDALQKLIHSYYVKQIPAVISCSALHKSDRDYLRVNNGRLQFVYLHGEPGFISKRLANRFGHFIKGNILQNAFESVEPPADALIIDAQIAPTEIVKIIRENLGL